MAPPHAPRAAAALEGKLVEFRSESGALVRGRVDAIGRMPSGWHAFVPRPGERSRGWWVPVERCRVVGAGDYEQRRLFNPARERGRRFVPRRRAARAGGR